MVFSTWDRIPGKLSNKTACHGRIKLFSTAQPINIFVLFIL